MNDKTSTKSVPHKALLPIPTATTLLQKLYHTTVDPTSQASIAAFHTENAVRFGVTAQTVRNWVSNTSWKISFQNACAVLKHYDPDWFDRGDEILVVRHGTLVRVPKSELKPVVSEQAQLPQSEAVAPAPDALVEDLRELWSRHEAVAGLQAEQDARITGLTRIASEQETMRLSQAKALASQANAISDLISQVKQLRAKVEDLEEVLTKPASDPDKNLA